MQVYRPENNDYNTVTGLTIFTNQGTDISLLRRYFPGNSNDGFILDGVHLSLPKESQVNQPDTVEPIVFLGNNKNGQPYIVAYGIVGKVQNNAMKIIGSSLESVQGVAHMGIDFADNWGLGTPGSQGLRKMY